MRGLSPARNGLGATTAWLPATLWGEFNEFRRIMIGEKSALALAASRGGNKVRRFGTAGELNRESERVAKMEPFVHDNGRPRVVVLGTGWASMHFFRYLDHRKYNICVISPRNYFTFTPLLPSICSGTLSPLACIEPVRNFTRRDGKLAVSFFEASCTEVDFDSNNVLCKALGGDEFRVSYDNLVVGVGAESNTFGIPGVDKQACFLKEVEHAVHIRKAAMNNFERAALPTTTPEERDQLLHFVVVGGGPTGVETAAEFSDFIREDMSRYMPEVMRHFKLTLIEMGPKLLPMFSNEVSEFTKKTLQQKCSVEVLTHHAVTSVGEKSLTVEDRRPGMPLTVLQIPHGFVLWASGVGQVPLTKFLLSSLPSQKGKRAIAVDEKLRVVGTSNVYAFGDCKIVEVPKLEDKAEQLLTEAGQDGLSSAWLSKHASHLMKTYPQLSSLKWDFSKKPSRERIVTTEAARAYLAEIDAAYRPPAPTAQNARQEGWYLAECFNTYVDPADRHKKSSAFCEKWSGSLAYVGANQAVGTLPRNVNMLGGVYSMPFWKAVYVRMQLSWRSRTVCLFDWLRTQLAGRDVGRDHALYK